MLRGIYSLFYIGVYPFFLPREFLKKPKELRTTWIKERFALYTKAYFSSLKRKKVWIHAVSVGEVLAVVPLVKRLSEEFDVVLSTITETGREVALNKLKGLPVKVIFLPVDCPFAVRRAISAIKPSMLLIAETEIWPNLIMEAVKKMPVALINARLSEKSYKRYKKLSFFFAPILNSLSFIGVQEKIYAERFADIGVKPEKLYLTGNVKFDLEIKDESFPWAKQLPSPVIIAGSTHHPEEKLILESFLNVFSEGTLILAPRHPQRLEEVKNLVKSQLKPGAGFTPLTQLEKGELPQGNPFIILVDKMGVLGALYRICDLAIIGGSFIPHGGQNPLEAIYWKKPVIFGPSMENFPFIKEFLEKGLCFQTDSSALPSLLKTFKKAPQEFEKVGEKAYKLLKEKSGATKKTFDLVKKYFCLTKSRVSE